MGIATEAKSASETRSRCIAIRNRLTAIGVSQSAAQLGVWIEEQSRHFRTGSKDARDAADYDYVLV